MKKLNIGAGKSYIPNFVNIDIAEHAEITLDLSSEKLPFDDNSVDLIFSYHTLEHVPNYLFALSEIHRVLKHGGILLVGVPYVSSTKFNLINPYHLHHFSENSFNFFSGLKGSAVENNDIQLHKVYHKYYYFGLFKLIPYPLNRWCKNHLFNVVRKIDFGLVAIKNDNPIEYPSKSELKRLFKETMKKRVRYVPTEKRKSSPKDKVKRYLKNWWNGEI